MQDIQITIYNHRGKPALITCSDPGVLAGVTLHIVERHFAKDEPVHMVDGALAVVRTMSLADAEKHSPDIQPVAS